MRFRFVEFDVQEKPPSHEYLRYVTTHMQTPPDHNRRKHKYHVKGTIKSPRAKQRITVENKTIGKLFRE